VTNTELLLESQELAISGSRGVGTLREPSKGGIELLCMLAILNSKIMELIYFI
jgi:hypothetical protein